MTPINRSRDHSTIPAAAGGRSSRSGLRPRRRRPSIELIAEGVVAGYLHDISRRHYPTRVRILPDFHQ
jgi:hypothetical protein